VDSLVNIGGDIKFYIFSVLRIASQTAELYIIAIVTLCGNRCRVNLQLVFFFSQLGISLLAISLFAIFVFFHKIPLEFLIFVHVERQNDAVIFVAFFQSSFSFSIVPIVLDFVDFVPRFGRYVADLLLC